MHAMLPIEGMEEIPLRKDKQEFMDALRNGSTDATPERLSLANHIANSPDCQCDVLPDRRGVRGLAS